MMLRPHRRRTVVRPRSISRLRRIRNQIHADRLTIVGVRNLARRKHCSVLVAQLLQTTHLCQRKRPSWCHADQTRCINPSWDALDVQQMSSNEYATSLHARSTISTLASVTATSALASNRSETPSAVTACVRPGDPTTSWLCNHC